MVEEDDDYQPIGKIGNYYGGLYVKEEDGNYYWSIENWDGYFWQEITKRLYKELIRFENETGKNNDFM